MGSGRDDFLRRYATSPIHVARLERFLDAYGDAGDDDRFACSFIAWDRACPDGEAARIVAEIISAGVDASGRIVRLSDDVVQAAIEWMANETSLTVSDRAARLRAGLAALEHLE